MQPVPSKFQSHNGAIAAELPFKTMAVDEAVSIPQWCDCCVFELDELDGYIPSFNPTMVRLLHLKALFYDDFELVSIPQWCDCCGLPCLRASLWLACFNPTMVRLLPKEP